VRVHQCEFADPRASARVFFFWGAVERRRTTNDVTATPAPGGRAPLPSVYLPRRGSTRVRGGRDTRGLWSSSQIRTPGHGTLTQTTAANVHEVASTDRQAGGQGALGALRMRVLTGTSASELRPHLDQQTSHDKQREPRVACCQSRSKFQETKLFRKQDEGAGPPWGRIVLLELPLRIKWKSIDDVVFRFPLCACFALLPQIVHRHSATAVIRSRGGSSSP
jgi:hypothetical protein